MGCGVGHRHGLALALLWLWCRPAAVAPVRPLAWEPLYALGATQKDKRQKKKTSLTKWALWKCSGLLKDVSVLTAVGA